MGNTLPGCVARWPCDYDSAQNTVDPVLQSVREHSHQPGDERLQFGQTIAGRQHDDNRGRQFAVVLLVLDAPIHRDERVEALGVGELLQEAVSRTCPAQPNS